MRRRKQTDVLPWYRARDYKGPLTEAEKRKLDMLRSQPKHPSTQYEDLPEEVQGYINQLEIQVNDFKLEQAASKALVPNLLGIVWVYFEHTSLSLSSFWTWTLGLLLFIVPWLVYWRESKKIAKEFLPDEPNSVTDEAIRREWEVSYIVRQRRSTDD